MNQNSAKSKCIETKLSPEHLVVDIVAAPSEILASNSRRTLCSLCGQSFRDYGSCKAHEFLQHAVLSRQGGEVRQAEVTTLEATSSAANFRPVVCRQEVRYYCPVEDCRFSLPHPKSQTSYPEPNGKLGKFFNEMRYLKEHYLRQHSESSLQCGNCSMKCRSEKELQLHESGCHANVCLCGKKIKTRAGFCKHIKNCHKYSMKRDFTLPCAERIDFVTKKSRSAAVSPNLKTCQSIRPKLAKVGWPLLGCKTAKNLHTLSVNSCIQTTESLFSRSKNIHVSTGAQCIPYAGVRGAGKICQQVQAGGDYDDLLSSIRSSGAQTIALLVKPSAGLQIDVYTQTDLLNDSDGFSSQEASALFQFLEQEVESNRPEIQTQTIESELTPFLLPSNSMETQTFEDFYTLNSGSSHGILSAAYSTESLGTQTSAYMDGLIEEFVQESVDMETQTLEKLDNCFVWEYTDADTQTSGLRDFLRISDF